MMTQLVGWVASSLGKLDVGNGLGMNVYYKLLL